MEHGSPTIPSPVPHTSYHTTSDIIHAAQNNFLPNKILITFHPQRWTDQPLPWIKELIWQNVKNQVKRILIRQSD